MNLGKGASFSLSEESDSFKLRLNFLFEKKAIFVIDVGALLISPWWTLLTVISTERFRCQRGRSISVLSKQYETSYCNSIFLVLYNLLSNIRVCVFISDPFRGHNSYFFLWSHAPPPTTESNFRRGWTKGGNIFPLAETRIQYQYTGIKNQISSFCQMLFF